MINEITFLVTFMICSHGQLSCNQDNNVGSFVVERKAYSILECERNVQLFLSQSALKPNYENGEYAKVTCSPSTTASN